jgi:NarL family two-component system response regulator LiaR
MSETIRILVADDHAVVREGLRALISTEPGMELVGEARDGLEALAMVKDLRPDVILMDVVMPRMDGLAAINEIRRDFPEARILVLTTFAEDDIVFPAIKSGAQGYLLKDSSPQELLQAIRNVHRGEGSLHPTIAARLMRELNQPSDLPPTKEPLTNREVEILKLIAQGMSNEEIAQKLVLSERTVRTHVSNILAKLQLANRTQAALYALREGFASLKSE